MKLNWLVFVDESGDHGLVNFDPYYPIFVLAALLVTREDHEALGRDFARLKAKYWPGEKVVFHEREIRRREGPYAKLGPGAYEGFLSELTRVVDGTPFQLMAVVVDKRRLVKRYARPLNPYELALGFVMERVALEVGPGYPQTLPFFLEARGRKEDRELLRVAKQLRSGEHLLSRDLDSGLRATLGRMRFEFKRKDDLLPGLELADLVAWPVGHRYLYPKQKNRAFSVVEQKFRRSPKGRVEGWGLKVFP